MWLHVVCSCCMCKFMEALIKREHIATFGSGNSRRALIVMHGKPSHRLEYTYPCYSTVLDMFSVDIELGDV